MTRITLDRLELAQKFRLALTFIFARHAGQARHLLNPRTSEAAERNRAHAIHQVAELLTEAFFTSKHEVTREAVTGDGEEILARLREAAARRGFE